MLLPRSSVRPAGRCVAILIGINEYRNGVPRLRNAVRDVQTIAQVLGEKHGYEVRLVLDEQATLTGLRSLLSGLPAQISEDTRLILYFAGHGIARETEEDASGPQGFLIPQDAQGGDRSTFLPMTEVQTLLSKLPCKHLLLLLDCCFAGAFRWSQTRSLRVQPATLYKERYERYLRDPAWQVIASAASDETALDAVAGGMLGRRGAENENSPFAAVLCQGLHGAADVPTGNQPGDGIIVANELHVYLENRFSQLENQIGRPMQKPLLWSFAGRDKGQFVFLTPGRSILLPSALELSEANNPYRGLEPYDEKNASLFFGRNEVIEQLRKQVEAQPLTVVSGISGSGKSSVVRAGLLSRLRAEKDWHILPWVRPGDRPLSALASLPGTLGTSEAGDLGAAVASFRATNPGKRVLLVIDQLEELVTMGAAPAEQHQFMRSIFKALSENSGSLHVVMTLRSDFEPHFAELLSSKTGAQLRFLVRPMNRQELRQVIEGPASERVLYFEPASLVDQLIDEVAEMPGALPLLSFTMSELYRAYVRSGRSDRCLAEADYQKLNGVAGALSQRADEIFKSLAPALQDTLRRVMLRMVVLDAGEMARRRVPMDELRHGDGHPEEARVKSVLALMQDARLVVSGNDSDGGPYVEPTHDKLVLGWPTLVCFLKDEYDTLPLQRRLSQAARDWAASKRDQRRLWVSDPRLPQVLALLRDCSERWNATERAFIEQSESARRRQRAQTIAILVGVIAVLLGTTIYALVSRQQAVTAQKRETEQRVRAERTTQEERGGRAKLLRQQRPGDIEALHTGLLAVGPSLLSQEEPPPAAIEGLMDAVQAGGYPLLPPWRHEGKIKDARFSPDGVRALTASDAGTVRLWDTRTGDSLATLTGHTEEVRTASFSPDGARVVTASFDHTARLWDAKTGASLATLAGHTEWVSSATFSPDGTRVITTSMDRTARLWDAKIGAPLATLTGHTAEVTEASFSPDGARVATASTDFTARLWDAKTGAHLFTLPGHQAGVFAASFSPDGTCVATAASDGTARLWDAKTGASLLTLKGHKRVVNVASFSPDGARVLTAGDDGTARLWDAKDGSPLLTFTGHRHNVRTASFSPDGARVLTAGDDGTARLWDTKTGSPLATLIEYTNGFMVAAHFSPDGTSVLTANLEGTARLWDVRTGGIVAALKGHTDGVWAMNYSPDGSRVVTAGLDGTSRLWDTKTGVPLATLTERDLGGVLAASFSPDGTRVLTANQHGSARLWEAKSGTVLATLKGHDDAVLAASFSPDGTRVVTAGEDSMVRLWDATAFSPLVTLWGHNAEVRVASFSPDGTRVVTASDDGTALLWDFKTRDERKVPPRLRKAVSPVATLSGHSAEVRAASFSPDGTRVATAGADGTARLWDAKTGAPLATLTGHTKGVRIASFSPDATRVLTASDDGTARLWDAKDGSCLFTLSGHTNYVWAARFSPDGTRVVTASHDGTARLWDVKTGAPLATFAHHKGMVAAATFSPDGSQIATAGEDGMAFLYSTKPMYYVTRACALLRGHPDVFKDVAEVCMLAAGGSLNSVHLVQ